VGLVLGQGMLLASVGIGCGLIAALMLTPFARGLLFSIPPNDPATFAMTGALFCAIALAACWIPARQASRVDPLVAIRQ
jgi:ABC-type antimicrobial peptide transport system permease subunit